MRAWLLRGTVALGVLGLAGAAGVLLYLQGQGVTPRALAPWVEKRSTGHHELVASTGQWLGSTLRSLDRGAAAIAELPALTVGAQPAPTRDRAIGIEKIVHTTDEARRALAGAVSGDAITFAPGTYRIRAPLVGSRPGVPNVPIVVRAERPGTVILEVEGQEGIVVSAPHWTFENLEIRGVCSQQAYCEHAFHVVGKGHHFVARNNTIVDFNAHFKINGDRNGFPDHGLIEANTLTNSSARRTPNPVTPIDLVAASDWVIRGNLITDFVKAAGDRISYGAFAKGGGARTLFERNVVLCEQKLQGMPGQRVGLSFGGGGTGKAFCRDGRCITEQDQGVMRANLVAACSDAGIYVNSGAATRIVDNTLLDTAGVQLRYPETSADLDGNVIDGPITSRNGAAARLGDNRDTAIAALYVGMHPQRSLYAAPARLDLRWKDRAPHRTASEPSLDLCGTHRSALRAYGAFDDFAACLAPRPSSTSAAIASSSAAN